MYVDTLAIRNDIYRTIQAAIGFVLSLMEVIKQNPTRLILQLAHFNY